MASFAWPPLGSGGGGGGSGTVTSVGLALPASVFSLSGTPVSISGTLTGAFIVQTANTVFAGPISGVAAVPAFRALVAADLPTGNLTDVGTDGITIGNGSGSVIGTGTTISQHVADATHNGYLASADWSTFNGKQASGSYLTALTGDGTASGPGSAALTLATVNVTTGSFGSATSTPNFVVNGKGLITAAASTSIQIAESQVTNLVSDLAGKQATGSYLTALTGDVTASGPGSSAATLATVNANVGSFTNTSLTVNAKGLVTAASSGAASVTTLAAVGSSPNANAATISGSTLNLQPFDGTHPGVVPASGGGTTNFLRADGSFATPSAGASALNVTSQTTNYSAALNDFVSCSAASFTITLPDATVSGSAGKIIVIQWANGASLGSVYTVNSVLSQIISFGGANLTTFGLFTPGETITLLCTGGAWTVSEHKTDTGWNTISTIPITSTSAHVFTIPSSSVTAGAVYSNNGINFTVSLTIASSTTLTCSGIGNPLAATNTLTKVSGVGPSTLSYTAVTNSQPVKGTTTADQLEWRRLGDSVEVQLNLAAAVGTSGTGDYLWDFSSFGSVNTGVVPVSTIPLGASLTTPAWSQWLWGASGLIQSTSSFAGVINVCFYSPTLFKIQGTGSENGFMGSAVNQLGLAVGVSARFTVPVTGWQP